ncbi:MAG: hypothetical protein MI919_28465, partial [Holophagales bacterium]|nr:hypothetical protein [Holophagales bacterium]
VLCGWLAGELEAAGVEVIFVGMLTTPGITATVLARRASGGIAVSASHNPHPDNGIKLIDHRGFKWTPEAEAGLESAMEGVSLASSHSHQLAPDGEASARYLDALAATLEGERPLDGLAVALDTGHGAASPFAGPLFQRLGARVRVVHDEPDGMNINLACGSTHPQKVARLTRDGGYDLGFAFDGDADRVVLADERGEVRDGDAVLYLWARDLHRRGLLPGAAIVATSMSNLGLEVALRHHGITVERCGVGDREVVALLRQRGLILGGEQSGHIIQLHLATTGDGLLTALAMADLVNRSGKSLSELLAGFERYPQLLRNLRVARKPPLESLPSVTEASRAVCRTLGEEGRLVLRYSGTEPLVRIMIEGPDQGRIETLADRLEAVLAKELAE